METYSAENSEPGKAPTFPKHNLLLHDTKHNRLAREHPDNPPQLCYAEAGPKPRLNQSKSET